MGRGNKIKRPVNTVPPSKMEKEWHPPRRMESPCRYCEGMVRYETRLHEAMDFIDRLHGTQGSTLEGYCTTTCFFLHRAEVRRQNGVYRPGPWDPPPVIVQDVENRVRIPIEINWRQTRRHDHNHGES